MPQREQIDKQSGALVQMCFKALLKFDRWEPIQNYIKVEAIKPGKPDTSKLNRVHVEVYYINILTMD